MLTVTAWALKVKVGGLETGHVTPYVVDGDDASFPQKLERFLEVIVVVLLVSVDEHEVERLRLPRGQKLIWDKNTFI